MNGDSLQTIPLTDVHIDDAFWNPRLEINREVTIEHQYQQLQSNGSLENFRKAADGEDDAKFEGIWFLDSDVYKWLEAASYVLATHHSVELETRVDDVISLVAAAQADDGYLNTYFILEAPDRRWENLNLMHELYCAGHLIEAAVAHYEATGEDSLLSVARRFADHIDDQFGPDGDDGIPGHEGIELALVKLARVTDDGRYLALARYFVENRGREDSRLKDELERIDDLPGSDIGYISDGTKLGELSRDHFLDENGEYDGHYAQDHAPIRDQDTVEGHSVRAMYFYTAVADLIAESPDTDDELQHALERLWENMTTRRMYVTGGIGSEHRHEGFTEDYHLPNETAYAETCAAIGSVFWSQRMLELTGERRFADLIELALYNGFLAGVSLEGTKFFYENPLASSGDHHREGWFDCACCPPNAARLLASLGEYLYLRSTDGSDLYVNQFVGSTVTTTVGESSVTLTQQTDYPWEGDVRVDVAVEEPTAFALHLRVPSWCENPTVTVDGETRDVDPSSTAYATLERTWKDGDRVTLSFGLPIDPLRAHPAVENDAGRIALRRGPLVYCLEATDHDRSLSQYAVDTDQPIEPSFEDDLLEGVTVLTGSARVPTLEEWDEHLYLPDERTETESLEFTAVPYYAWDNREPGSMRVWLRTTS